MSTPARSLSRRKRLLFTLATVIAFFVLLETGLRLGDAGRPPVIGSLRFGYRTGIPIYDEDGVEAEDRPYALPLFQADAWLFWKPIADTPFTGADGLRKPVPVTKDKPPHVYRVAVIGDSCSFLGLEPYPTRFATLAGGALGQTVEVINASCPGYTSFQCRRRLDDVWPWAPDLVVVYCGWNDHWRSPNGSTDADVAARVDADGLLPSGLHRIAQRCGIYWTLRSLLAPAPSAPRRDAPARVPPEDYRANLESIVADCVERGCEVVLITAPTTLVAGALPAWTHAFFGRSHGMTRNQVEAIPATHEAYNAIMRTVAERAAHVSLLDLAAQWEAGVSTAMFRRDGIHLTEPGHEAAARALFELWSDPRRGS